MPITVPTEGALVPTVDQWDLNVQAVQDAKKALAETKAEFGRLLRERALVARVIQAKGVRRVQPGEFPEFDALTDRAVLTQAIAWACVEDLTAARERFKNAEGC